MRDFVAEYRALSVDLARLRTAARGEAADELFYLGRLVAGAHNLLYRERRSSLRDILRFIAIDVPTEVRRSATETLIRRDPRDFLGRLIGVLRDPPEPNRWYWLLCGASVAGAAILLRDPSGAPIPPEPTPIRAAMVRRPALPRRA